MQFFKSRSLFVFFGILSLGGFGALESTGIFESSKQELRKKTYSFSLDNGLRVILLEKKGSPTLAVYTKFLVGAVDETPEEAGTAHLLEHMLFKGTTQVGTKDYTKEKKYQDSIEVLGAQLDDLRLQIRNLEKAGQSVPKSLREEFETIAKRLKIFQDWQDRWIEKNEDSYIYEQNGGVGFNAYTSQDVTNYQIQIPKNRLEVWAKLESNRLLDPIYREFYTERDVILEERKMRTDNSGSALLRERFYSVAFESHPYRKPVIGYESGIPFLRLDETMKFFRKHYSPDKMVIAIVGDVDFAEAERIVLKYFSGLKRGEKRRELKTLEPQSLGKKTVELLHPSSPTMLLGWHKPAPPHPTNAVFDVVSALLTNGTSSRLYKRLVVEEKLCLGVNAGNGYPGERYSNLFVISTRNTSEADPKRIEEIIWEEIQKLKSQPISQDELQRVQNSLTADFLRGLEGNEGLADMVSYYELLFGNWESLFGVYEDIYKTDSTAIQNAVKQYITPERVVVGILKDSRKPKTTGEKP